jgi:myo-inositol-1(or 4)-monophosphatase
MDELTIYREAACEAARRGAAVLASWREKFQVREKGHADLVTDADLASQEAVRGYLHERFPDHAFLAEEGPAANNRPGPGAPPT